MSFRNSSGSLSGMALGSISAVVFDTETTGLNVSVDRVIEIGAVRLDGGVLDEADRWQEFVNPGLPIPAASSEIHHITDRDVTGAPEFATAMTGFANWAGPAVILGYSVGFDLAVLKAEHERAGMTWNAPRTVDVRHLVQLAAPALPDQSLDTVAGWLGLEVADRHRALGDARLTALVFLALVPKLRERGIFMLAQAERACRSLASRAEEEKAGWLEAAHPGADTTNIAEYARIDSFPYRHRVAELMSPEPLLIAHDTSLKDALALMLSEKVSSLFLSPEAGGGDYGIITERDIMRAVGADGGKALDVPVNAFAARPLMTVAGSEFVYRALTMMADQGFRHLGVRDAAGELTGALSMRDLLRLRAGDGVSLDIAIEGARSPAELGRVWPGLISVARTLVQEDVDARDVAAVISRELRALTRRACELAEEEMAAAGRGKAPVPFALLVLGSGGRGESLLAMDQDNAIVYDADASDQAGNKAGSDEQTTELWFADLGTRVADILNEAGVAYCKGGVMASNAAWRMDIADWRTTLGSWISRSRPEDILNCDIFFDARPVHGDRRLAEALRGEAISAAGDARTFLRLLAMNARDYEEATGWLGRLKLKGGRIDLKRTGLMPIFSAARVAALEHGIAVRSTPDRLAAARDRGIASERTVKSLIDAHGIFLNQILRQQLRDIDEGIALSNRVAPGELAAAELQQLRWALGQVAGVSDVLGMPLLG